MYLDASFVLGTSVIVERFFSQCKLVLSDRRASLTPQKLKLPSAPPRHSPCLVTMIFKLMEALSLPNNSANGAKAHAKRCMQSWHQL